MEDQHKNFDFNESSNFVNLCSSLVSTRFDWNDNNFEIVVVTAVKLQRGSNTKILSWVQIEYLTHKYIDLGDAKLDDFTFGLNFIL